MYNTQKIEPALWPWSYLQVTGIRDQETLQEIKDTVPTIMPQGNIGSNTDVHLHFNDSYVDLSKDVEYLNQLSINADQNYI